jgi:cytochrome c biogenesis factor
MYAIALGVHNLVRWLVLAAGLWVVIRVWRGWMSRAAWTDADSGAVRLFVNVLSLQFVLGLLLYAVSPLVRQGLRDMGAAMRDPAVRYFVVEHVAMMILAVAVAHIGAARVRKAGSDSAKFQTASIWFLVALAAILAFIPWGRPLVPSF